MGNRNHFGFAQMLLQATRPDSKTPSQNIQRSKRAAFDKYPRILRKNVVTAINNVESLAKFLALGDSALDLLSKHRENRPLGITNPRYAQQIDPILFDALKRLDESFRAIHDYQAVDYFSEGTFREGQRRLGKSAKRQNEAIKCYLREAGYLDAKGTKGKIKKTACLRFSVESRHIDNLVRELKLEQQE